MKTDVADVVIVGAGAAGLFAAIFAARTNPDRRIVLIDGAKTLGAKILVAGGGRCNVTHDVVGAEAYAGSSQNAIKKVLKRFDVPETIAFFKSMGVELKREETGKLFPVSDSARTILHALLTACRQGGVALRHPYRVEAISQFEGGLRVSGTWGSIDTGKVILATGGKSLPKSGSDGGGYPLAQALGHTLTERIFPALVPLVLPANHFLRGLSGIATVATVSVRSSTGKRLQEMTDSLLCTHFGLSGPAILDISRHYLNAIQDDRQAQLVINWLPAENPEVFESKLIQPSKQSIAKFLSEYLPERLARAICESAQIDPLLPILQLTRDMRKQLMMQLFALVVPVFDSRGFTYAEVTAGGIPLSEIRLETMQSRICPQLHLCGEICDVDGRIGGYNFQWAWSSGYIAGVSV